MPTDIIFPATSKALRSGSAFGERPNGDSTAVSERHLYLRSDISTEPEGQSVFDELDQIAQDPRSHGLKRVLLWFRSYKNALSTYTPAWIKRDMNRFPRVEIPISGQQVLADAVSIFGTTARDAVSSQPSPSKSSRRRC
ncbi:hypothetical protein AC578_8461 [Pseudocercospora eumusae]|uniref:Uncharacterized protein n=1 Tax=Pseudocercospora eumusae TaxID=321146 RepID=A0A139GXD8_9PEZI|nr:hypothetical protein AC578_8461 [Pseudocercospora eumusae]